MKIIKLNSNIILKIIHIEEKVYIILWVLY